MVPLELVEINSILQSKTPTVKACGFAENNLTLQYCYTTNFFQCNNNKTTVSLPFDYQSGILAFLLLLMLVVLTIFQLLIYAKKQTLYYLLQYKIYTKLPTKIDWIIFGTCIIGQFFIYILIKHYIFAQLLVKVYPYSCGYYAYYVEIMDPYSGPTLANWVFSPIVTLMLILPVAVKVYYDLTDMYDIPLKLLIEANKGKAVRGTMVDLLRVKYRDLVHAIDLYSLENNVSVKKDPVQLKVQELDMVIVKYLPKVLKHV